MVAELREDEEQYIYDIVGVDKLERAHNMSPVPLHSEHPLMDRSFLTASIPDVVARLTDDEKAELLSGKSTWETRDVSRLNIPS